MTEQFAIDVARNAFMVALQIGGPLLAGSLVVGMMVSNTFTMLPQLAH